LFDSDRDSWKKPVPVCPRCGADTTEKELPWDSNVISGIVAVVILFTFVSAAGREFIYLLVAVMLAFWVGRDRPSWYRCTACKHQFYYPPVYKNDLPSESALKRQRSRATPEAVSDQAQVKGSEGRQTILLVVLLFIMVSGMLSVVAKSGRSSSDHPSELELPPPLGALQHTWHTAREKRALEAAARDGDPEAAWQLYAYAEPGAEADAWLCLAVHGLHPDAQYEVARRHWYVTEDHVHGYMWYTLAAANGSKSAAVEVKDLWRELTAAQLAEAERLVTAWKPAPKNWQVRAQQER